ncbi:MAG: hypothetical protein JSS29_12145 [Proteobacteria bacterium]|nr:hypothetical protein [Pseudomonadota bacterium]
MRKHVLHAAIAAALAGTAAMSANAASYWLNISGASAQRTLWENDLEAIATGKYGSTVDNGGTTVCTLTKTAAVLNTTSGANAGFGVPDLHTLVCTISSNRFAGAPTLPSPVAAGDVVTLYYGAEYGSVWGIAPFIPGSTASTRGRAVLAPLAGGGTQAVTGYNRDLDTATSGLLAPLPVDIGVSDNEPILWASQDNWAYSDGLKPTQTDGTGTNNVINVLSIPGQGQPTLAQLEASEQSGWGYVNGEVFAFVVDNTAAPTNALSNLSTQSLRAIFTGQYKTWSQVPEATGLTNNSASIVLCRRDHGSGSEVTLSKFLTLSECGGNNGINGAGNASGAAPRIASLATNPAGSAVGSLDQTVGGVDGISSNPVENYSTNDIKACLAANPGVSIGVIVNGPGSAYTTLKVDGIEANIHNAAMGLYQFIAEDWAINNTATSQAGNANAAQAVALAGQLITDVKKTTGVLPSENGAFSGGQWIASGTASGQLTNFYLQDSINAKPTVSATAETGNPSIPTATWTNTGKSACTILNNNNK